MIPIRRLHRHHPLPPPRHVVMRNTNQNGRGLRQRKMLAVPRQSQKRNLLQKHVGHAAMKKK